jgi:hypothetical protein
MILIYNVPPNMKIWRYIFCRKKILKFNITFVLSLLETHGGFVVVTFKWIEDIGLDSSDDRAPGQVIQRTKVQFPVHPKNFSSFPFTGYF